VSHIKLVVTISTDGDDMAQRRAVENPLGLMVHLLEEKVIPGLRRGYSESLRIYDANGNRVGDADLSEVID